MVAVVNMEKLFQGLLCCTACRCSSKRFIFRSLNFTYEMVMIVMFTSAFLNYFNIKVIIVIISAASSLSERATSPSFRQHSIHHHSDFPTALFSLFCCGLLAPPEAIGASASSTSSSSSSSSCSSQIDSLCFLFCRFRI